MITYYFGNWSIFHLVTAKTGGKTRDILRMLHQNINLLLEIFMCFLNYSTIFMLDIWLVDDNFIFSTSKIFYKVWLFVVNSIKNFHFRSTPSQDKLYIWKYSMNSWNLWPSSDVELSCLESFSCSFYCGFHVEIQALRASCIYFLTLTRFQSGIHTSCESFYTHFINNTTNYWGRNRTRFWFLKCLPK